MLLSTFRKQLEEEQKILDSVREDRALLSNKEIAEGTNYFKSLRTSWRPPKWILRKGMFLIDFLMYKYLCFENNFYC